MTTTCTVQMFRKLLDEGRAGEDVGVLLRDTKREEINGQVLTVPARSRDTKFEAEVYVVEGRGTTYAVL